MNRASDSVGLRVWVLMSPARVTIEARSGTTGASGLPPLCNKRKLTRQGRQLAPLQLSRRQEVRIIGRRHAHNESDSHPPVNRLNHTATAFALFP
jgi:hypothetical protein